jgi:hypothetical protein
MITRFLLAIFALFHWTEVHVFPVLIADIADADTPNRLAIDAPDFPARSSDLT